MKKELQTYWTLDTFGLGVPESQTVSTNSATTCHPELKLHFPPIECGGMLGPD
jgi:hypothetical protein